VKAFKRLALLTPVILAVGTAGGFALGRLDAPMVAFYVFGVLFTALFVIKCMVPEWGMLPGRGHTPRDPQH